MGHTQFFLNESLASRDQEATACQDALSVDAKLAALQSADKTDLRRQWGQAFGNAPPPRLSCEFMILGLSWEIQAEVYGGLSKKAIRTLSKHADPEGRTNGDVRARSKTDITLSPGTTLVREWRGKTYQVVALEDGYQWNDIVWKSLSKIAHEITGVKRNGPAFFGLRRKIRGQS